MIVFVGMETSGMVRRAFQAKGIETYSCDLLPSDDNGEEMVYSPDGLPLGRHLVGDVFETLDNLWLNDLWPSLAIFHPPCTRLCNSGVRWLDNPPPGKTREQMHEELAQGAELFSRCLNINIDRVCVENPVMHKYAKQAIWGYRHPVQSIQPWQFGHGEVKRTCLWLNGLMPLRPTNIVDGREAKVHRMSPGPDRWKARSKTYPGIAQAMADQWAIAH